jgi:hypothetical protein
MARIALRYILIALIAASLLVIATIALVRLAPLPTTITQQVPIDSIAVALDANGAGTQVLDDAILAVSVLPYPPRAGQPVTITLVALDRVTGATMMVTPTLSVADADLVEGSDIPLARDAGGAYAATGALFPAPGEWRARVRVDFGAEADYSMIVLARVE